LLFNLFSRQNFIYFYLFLFSQIEKAIKREIIESLQNKGECDLVTFNYQTFNMYAFTDYLSLTQKKKKVKRKRGEESYGQPC